MGKTASPYYPPRARWYSPLLSVVAATRRSLGLNCLHLPAGVTVPGLLGGALVPGLAVYLKGPRPWGKAALGVSALLASIFFIWLGYRVSGWAFALLLSIHVTGVVYYLDPVLAGVRLRFRMLCSVSVLALLGLMLYLPVRDFLEKHCFMPMTIRDRVMVIKPGAVGSRTKRGDWVAYRLADHSRTGFYFRAGYGLGPVLAVAGDRVRFTPTAYEVNGVEHPRLARMPYEGELLVPEHSFFVWPELDIWTRGQVPEGNVTDVLSRMAVVSPEQIVGKPFERWFWRKQRAS